MRKIKWVISFFAVFFGISFLYVVPASAAGSKSTDPMDYGEGLTGEIPPTQEELQWIEENMVHTAGSGLNPLGIERVNEECEKQGMEQYDSSMTVEFGEEAISEEETKRLRSARQQLPMEALPSSVDNMNDEKTKNYFPPIVRQIGSSCAAYSTTYYIMTYMNAMAKGYNVTADSSKILSPRFTYNLGNSGRDAGMGGTTGFAIALKHGCPSIVDFPVSGTNQHTAWPTTEEVWRNALDNKMKESGVGHIEAWNAQTPVSNNQDEDLRTIKTYLANGYILKMGTYFTSWQWKKSHDTNEDVCIAVDGELGSHGMTVVGYDDNIWVDINGNGTKEDGELGAFKIVNSHGSSWKGKGWAWFAYDALNKVSSVPDAPVYANRGQGWFNNAFYWITAYESYSPILTSKFTIHTNRRDQVSILLGQSGQSATLPSSTWRPYVFNNNGGAFSIDGTTTASDAAIVLDYTDLIKEVDLSQAGITKWYLQYNSSGGTFSNVYIKDETRNTSYSLTGKYTSGNNTYQYRQLSLPSIVDAGKQWNLKFNWPLESATAVKQNIFVRDTKNNDVNASVMLNSDEKTVAVDAPQGGYQAGKRYMVNVTKNVKTKGGNSLPSPAVFEFIVK